MGTGLRFWFSCAQLRKPVSGLGARLGESWRSLLRTLPRHPALPFGPLDPAGHRTLELGLRDWVREQTGLELGYAEQLYTFGDRHRDPRERAGGPRVLSIAYLALGLDPERTVFYRQSDVPEVVELAWMLSSVTGMGLLERAHSYKDKVARGIAASHGLFAYPVLMAADILIYDSNLVPVGRDQKQHVEVTRDIAVKSSAPMPKMPALTCSSIAVGTYS